MSSRAPFCGCTSRSSPMPRGSSATSGSPAGCATSCCAFQRAVGGTRAERARRAGAAPHPRLPRRPARPQRRPRRARGRCRDREVPPRPARARADRPAAARAAARLPAAGGTAAARGRGDDRGDCDRNRLQRPEPPAPPLRAQPGPDSRRLPALFRARPGRGGVHANASTPVSSAGTADRRARELDPAQYTTTRRAPTRRRNRSSASSSSSSGISVSIRRSIGSLPSTCSRARRGKSRWGTVEP